MTLILALTNLWRNRMRTAFTAAGVVIVVAAYLAVSYYFSVVASHVPVKPAPSPADVVVSLSLPASDVADFLASYPQIEAYEPVELASLATPFGVAECAGVVPRSRFLPFGKFEAGGPPEAAGQIAVPSKYANFGKAVIGSKVALASRGFGSPIKHEYTVVGIFAPKDLRYDVPVMLTEDLRTIARTSVRYMLKLKQGTNVMRFASVLSDDETRVKTVETAMGVTSARADEDWKATWGAAQSSAQMLVSVVLIIAGLGVLNTMMVSALQRRREFGIMKACGMLEGQVIQLFAQEGLILAILGYSLGVAVYFGGLFSLHAAGRLETVTATPTALITGAVQALVVCVVPSLIPANDVMARTARDLLSSQ